MLRVGDLQRSIDFYTRVMGMQLLRTTERPEQKYSLAFVGYGVEPGAGRDRAHLQPRRRARTSSAPPTATSRSASTDVYAACEQIRAGGGAVTREPGPVKGGTTVIAFVTDPDGYKIELIERDGLRRSLVAAAGVRPAAQRRSPRAPGLRDACAPVAGRERVGRRQPRAADDLDVRQRQVVRRASRR